VAYITVYCTYLKPLDVNRRIQAYSLDIYWDIVHVY